MHHATEPGESVVPWVEATDVQLAAVEAAPVSSPVVAPAAAAAAGATTGAGVALLPSLQRSAEGTAPIAVEPAGSSAGPAEGTDEPGDAASAGTMGEAHPAVVSPREDGVAVGNASGVTTRVAALAQILARVRDARRYPEAARRRELEGLVRVRFFVGADGRPHDVTASDGEATLQRAAIEAVERAAPLPFVDGPVEVDEDFRLDATP